MAEKLKKPVRTQDLRQKIGQEFKAGYSRYILLAVSRNGQTPFVRCAGSKETMDARSVENYFKGEMTR